MENQKGFFVPMVLLAGFVYLSFLLFFNVKSDSEVAKDRAERVSKAIKKSELEIIDSYILVYGSRVYVVNDDKRGVTCWVLDGNKGDGISCIPSNQLLVEAAGN